MLLLVAVYVFATTAVSGGGLKCDLANIQCTLGEIVSKRLDLLFTDLPKTCTTGTCYSMDEVEYLPATTGLSLNKATGLISGTCQGVFVGNVAFQFHDINESQLPSHAYLVKVSIVEFPNLTPILVLPWNSVVIEADMTITATFPYRLSIKDIGRRDMLNFPCSSVLAETPVGEATIYNHCIRDSANATCACGVDESQNDRALVISGVDPDFGFKIKPSSFGQVFIKFRHTQISSSSDEAQLAEPSAAVVGVAAAGDKKLSMSAPLSISSCDPLAIVAIAEGLTGTERSSVPLVWQWKVEAEPVLPSSAQTALDQLLQDANSQGNVGNKYRLDFPSFSPALPAGHQYSITVRVQSWLDELLEETVVVTKRQAADLQITLPDAPRGLLRSQRIVLRPLFELSDGCSQSVARYSFQWNDIGESDNPKLLKLLLSTAGGKKDLVIPGNTLSSGSPNRLQVSVFLKSTLVSQASISIQVDQSPLLAHIKGGSSIYADAGKGLSLDGSASYDPDDLDNPNLNFFWNCQVERKATLAPTAHPTQTPTTAQPTSPPLINPTLEPTTAQPTFPPLINPTPEPTTAQPTFPPLINPTPRVVPGRRLLGSPAPTSGCPGCTCVTPPIPVEKELDSCFDSLAGGAPNLRGPYLNLNGQHLEKGRTYHFTLVVNDGTLARMTFTQIAVVVGEQVGAELLLSGPSDRPATPEQHRSAGLALGLSPGVRLSPEPLVNPSTIVRLHTSPPRGTVSLKWRLFLSSLPLATLVDDLETMPFLPLNGGPLARIAKGAVEVVGIFNQYADPMKGLVMDMGATDRSGDSLVEAAMHKGLQAEPPVLLRYGQIVCEATGAAGAAAQAVWAFQLAGFGSTLEMQVPAWTELPPAPEEAQLKISPNSGQGLKTWFTMDCGSLLRTSHPPFRYQFHYVDPLTGAQVSLGNSPSLFGQITSVLPAGRPTVVCVATDAAGYSQVVETSVAVARSSLGSSSFLASRLDVLGAARSLGSAAAVAALAAGMGSQAPPDELLPSVHEELAGSALESGVKDFNAHSSLQLAQAMFTLLERKDTKDLLDPAKVGLIAGSARPLADAVYSGLLPPDNNDASRTDSSFIAGQDRLTARLATSRLQQALSPLLRAPHRTGGDDTCRRRLELGRASLRAARAAMLGASAGETLELRDSQQVLQVTRLRGDNDDSTTKSLKLEKAGISITIPRRTLNPLPQASDFADPWREVDVGLSVANPPEFTVEAALSAHPCDYLAKTMLDPATSAPTSSPTDAPSEAPTVSPTTSSFADRVGRTRVTSGLVVSPVLTLELAQGVEILPVSGLALDSRISLSFSKDIFKRPASYNPVPIPDSAAPTQLPAVPNTAPPTTLAPTSSPTASPSPSPTVAGRVITDEVKFDIVTDNMGWCGQALQPLNSLPPTSGAQGEPSYVLGGEELFYVQNTTAEELLLCSFWDEEAGGWSQEGVETVQQSATAVECSTNHLSDFAILAYSEQETETATQRVYVPFYGSEANEDCVPDPGWQFYQQPRQPGHMCVGGTILFANARLSDMALLSGPQTEASCWNKCQQNTRCSCLTTTAAGACLLSAGGLIVASALEAAPQSAQISYDNNPCAFVDCGPNGNCDQANGACVCVNQFLGPYCGIAPGSNQDLCDSVECLNGGFCQADTGSCDCTDGYLGPQCQFVDDFKTIVKSIPPSPSGDFASQEMELLYLILFVLYGIASLASVTQLLRAAHYMNKTKRGLVANLLVIEMVAVCVLTMLRTAQAALRYFGRIGVVDTGDIGLLEASLSALPIALHVTCFSMIVATWAALVHFAMDRQSKSPFKKLKRPLILANIVTVLVSVGLAVGIVSTRDSDPEVAVLLAQVGSGVQAALVIVLLVLFCIYGRRMVHLLDRATGSSSLGGSSRGSKTHKKDARAQRTTMFLTGYIFVALLATTAWLVPTVDIKAYNDNAVVFASVMHFSDLAAIALLLLLFSSGVSNAKQEVIRKRMSKSATELAPV